MLYIGDTRAGTLVGTDRMGNKFYENMTEELPLRVRIPAFHSRPGKEERNIANRGALHLQQTRWIEYSNHELDASHIDPGWHAWISYLVDKPPPEDSIMKIGLRPWESPNSRINYTQSRGAYKPYST